MAWLPNAGTCCTRLRNRAYPTCRSLQGQDGLVVATDYMKIVGDQIRPFINDRRFIALRYRWLRPFRHA